MHQVVEAFHASMITKLKIVYTAAAAVAVVVFFFSFYLFFFFSFESFEVFERKRMEMFKWKIQLTNWKCGINETTDDVLIEKLAVIIPANGYRSIESLHEIAKFICNCLLLVIVSSGIVFFFFLSDEQQFHITDIIYDMKQTVGISN